MYNAFAEKYPSSQYLKDAEDIKKDAERGIEAVKKFLAIQQAELKLRESKQDTVKNNN
jgi:hypothetical protein